MELNFSTLSTLLGETFRRPQETARRLIALDLPMAARWQTLALVVVLSVLLLQVAIILTPGGGAEAGPFAGGVVQGGLLQATVLLVTIGAVHFFGRAFGGTGTFPDAVILLAWLQFVTLCLQVIQIVSLVLVPGLSGIIAIGSVVIFLWLLVSFVQALHDFRSRGLVLLGLIFSFFALAFVLSLILMVLGVQVEEL